MTVLKARQIKGFKFIFAYHSSSTQKNFTEGLKTASRGLSSKNKPIDFE